MIIHGSDERHVLTLTWLQDLTIALPQMAMLKQRISEMASRKFHSHEDVELATGP